MAYRAELCCLPYSLSERESQDPRRRHVHSHPTDNEPSLIKGHCHSGCGPGTITVDIASRVPDGHVTGVDYAPEPLEGARAHAAEKNVKNVEFSVADVFSLPFPDDTFDITFAHHVIQHTTDPVRALREMRRVTKPGGIVANREGDLSFFTYYPENEALSRLNQWFGQLARANGCEPYAGRRVHAWARQAGFEMSRITRTATTWCYSTPEEREFWAMAGVNRLQNSKMPESLKKFGLGTDDEIKEVVQALKDWMADEDGWFALIHGEIIARV